ncbi:MAG: hypothetical protein U1F36_11510 [Planctomycetota bacterium]
MDRDPSREQTGVDERRAGDRRPFEGEVVVEFGALRVTGSARNLSKSGVYFVAAERAEVMVQVAGDPRPRRAELIRLESLGPGRLGIAVRFLDPEA